MLALEEYVEVHALRRRGWSISAIPRHLGRDRKQSGLICWMNGSQVSEPQPSGIRSMSSSRMCVSGCPMIRMFGRRCCSTRWRLWAMRRAIPRLCGRCAIGVFARLVAPVRVPGVGPPRLLIIRRVRSASRCWLELGDTPWQSKAHVLVGALSHSGRFRAWITSSQDQPHLVEGIDAVLRRLGGTARRWRVDRMATVVVPGADRIQPSFVGVAKHYGVGVDPCPPRHPQRKGVVEKAIHYISQRWWRTAMVGLDASMISKSSFEVGILFGLGCWGWVFEESVELSGDVDAPIFYKSVAG